MPEESTQHINFDKLNTKAVSQPLVKHIYTAVPSAQVFNDKICIYPSHDNDAGDAFDDLVAILQWRIIISFRWITRSPKQWIMEWH